MFLLYSLNQERGDGLLSRRRLQLSRLPHCSRRQRGADRLQTAVRAGPGHQVSAKVGGWLGDLVNIKFEERLYFETLILFYDETYTFQTVNL